MADNDVHGRPSPATNAARQPAPAPLADRLRPPSAANGHALARLARLAVADPAETIVARLAGQLSVWPDADSHPPAARRRLAGGNPRHEPGSRQLAGLASRRGAQPSSRNPIVSTSLTEALLASISRHRPLPVRLEALSRQPALRSATQVLEHWAARCRLTPETVDAWRPLLGREDSRPFASFLARLDDCASFEPRHRADSAQELGSVLELAAHNDAYRARCFDICGGADANCHDNVDVIFGNLRLAARDPSYHGNAQLHEVLSYHNRCMPWTLIDDFVSHQFKRGDQLERVLALRIRLSDILPIATPAMLHHDIARIDDTHECEARTYISAHLGTQEKLLRNLSRSPAWRQFLEQQRPVEFAANTLLWESALQDVMAKPAGDGAVADAPRAASTAAPGSRTEALAQARAMPGIGTGQAFQHRQENATAMLAETMTRKLVMESAPPPDETGAHAALLTDPDWLTYLQKEHPEDRAFSPADMHAAERHDLLMRLTRQEIAEARGMVQPHANAPTDHG
ncbi:NEL-type E3 ubiquitin ligase domain-containing protein [Ralstonia pseudosolanacearum]|uniref:NEL-type E3 ubiquitin ligase domain-containing protein n=1 Tax=Ralstonia pseudosolanacearum TaxID=1310165 RepID=UPI003AAB4A70